MFAVFDWNEDQICVNGESRVADLCEEFQLSRKFREHSDMWNSLKTLEQ